MERRDPHTPLSEDYLRAHTISELKPLAAPIFLATYDLKWRDKFQHKAERIRSALGERALRIEHVGSTAVPDMPAKPVVDMLLVVADSANETEYAAAVEGLVIRSTSASPVGMSIGYSKDRIMRSICMCSRMAPPKLNGCWRSATGCEQTNLITSCMPDASEHWRSRNGNIPKTTPTQKLP